MIGAVPADQSRNSLFTEAEKIEFIAKEKNLIGQIKRGGDAHPLLELWKNKHNLMLQRADERGIPAAKVLA